MLLLSFFVTHAVSMGIDKGHYFQRSFYMIEKDKIRFFKYNSTNLLQ